MPGKKKDAHPLYIKLDRKLFELLEAKAKEKGKSKTALVEDILLDYLAGTDPSMFLLPSAPKYKDLINRAMNYGVKEYPEGGEILLKNGTGIYTSPYYHVNSSRPDLRPSLKDLDELLWKLDDEMIIVNKE